MTLLQTRDADRMARRFAIEAADALVAPGRKAALTAARLLSELSDAGAKADDLHELRKLLHDTFGNIQGGINRTLDNEGLHEDLHQIDVSWLSS